MFKIPILLVLLVFTLPAQAHFATVAEGVSGLSTAFGSQRKIVRDNSGILYVVLLKVMEDRSAVFLSRSDDDGLSWMEVGQVSDGQFNAARTTIAIDAQNRLHIFWTKFVPEVGEEEYGQIAYRMYDRGVWSLEEQLTHGNAYSGYPSAAVDSKGRIHLVWYGFDGEAYQVFYTMSEGGGWMPPIKLSQGFPDSVNPTVAVDSHDNVHVAWYKSNGRQYQIYYIRWSGSWGEQIVLSSGLTDSFNPTIAIDRNDDVYVVWDKGEAGQTQIYYSVFRNGAWSPQTQLTSGNEGAENPTVAVDAQGRVYVFYDKTDGQIYGLKYTTSWSPETRLTSEGENKYPSVRWSYYNNPATETDGTVDFVWTSKQAGITKVLFAKLTVSSPPSGDEGTVPFITTPGIVVAIAVGATLLLIASVRGRASRQT